MNPLISRQPLPKGRLERIKNLKQFKKPIVATKTTAAVVKKTPVLKVLNTTRKRSYLIQNPPTVMSQPKRLRIVSVKLPRDRPLAKPKIGTIKSASSQPIPDDTTTTMTIETTTTAVTPSPIVENFPTVESGVVDLPPSSPLPVSSPLQPIPGITTKTTTETTKTTTIAPSPILSPGRVG